MDMIERVARAIANADDNSFYERYLILAKAAIEAMREPTEEMINFAWDKRAVGVKGSWNTMIDAALQGK